MPRTESLTTRELSPSTWKDFEELFEKHNGVANGCWCMYYQRPSPIRTKMSRAERTAMNKRDKKSLVKENTAHGIIVYNGETPVGWCQYGLRNELPRIDAGRNYRKLEPVSQDKKLWRITCFFVDNDYRGKGVAKTALKAALQSIKRNGGGVVEAYPVASKKIAEVPQLSWFGTASMFERENFKPVSPLGTSYLLMRRTIPSS